MTHMIMSFGEVVLFSEWRIHAEKLVLPP